jgi:hypothetical protein
MFKKTLISLAVASSLGLTGCFSGSNSGGNDNPKPQYAGDALNTTYPLFNPAKRQIPTPTDLSFSGSLDGTFKLDLTEDSSPVEIALDSLSGASTVDPITIKTSGQIDKSSLKPNQNIFLIPLKYASGDPIQGLSNQEPPTVDQAKAAKTKFIVDVINVDDSTAIRISPTEPLAPNTRYVVGITKDVKDTSGKPIGQDPVYANITGEGTDNDPNFGLVNAALAPIRSLVNNLWEPIVTKFVAFSSNGASTLSADDIAMSYSFTTSNDVMVTRYIAYPENWLRDQLEGFVRVSTAKKVVGAARFASGEDLEQEEPSPLTGFQQWDLNEDDSIDAKDFDVNGDNSVTTADFLFANSDPSDFGFEDVNAAVKAAIATFKPSIALKNQLLTPCDQPPVQSGNLFDDQLNCVASALLTNFLGSPNAEPAARPIGNTWSSSRADAKSAVLASIEGSSIVDISENTIELPYYLGRPKTPSEQIPEFLAGAPIQTSSWVADKTYASTIVNALGLPLAQGKELSQAVTARFPFPQESGETLIEVPLLVIHPNSLDLNNASAGAIDDVVIFQHGITTDRSAAMAFGTALVASGLQQGRNIAVVAIDQPLHGVAPATREKREDLAETLLTSTVLRVIGVAPGATPTQEQLLTAEAFATAFAPALATDLITFEAQLQAVASDNTNDAQPIAAGLLNAQLDGTRALLADTVQKAGSTIPGLAPASKETGVVESGVNERHFGWGSNVDFDRSVDAGPANSPWAAMKFPTNPTDPVADAGESGDLFINLGNFLNSRDNLRQGVLDLLNLRASLPVEVGAFADADTKFHFVGHSLGTINGNAFVVAANSGDRPDLRIENSHLMTPASGVVRMLENSPSFAPTILAGLKQTDSDLTQASNNLQSFFTVFQAAIDTVDPINTVDQLRDSRTLISQMDGDRTTINAAWNTYYDDSISNWKEGYNVFSTDAFEAYGIDIDSQSPAPLAGSEPLAAWLLAGDFGNNELPAITRYEEGTHSTPVLPRSEVAEPANFGEAQSFAELEYEFLKDRTLPLEEKTIVTAANAENTFKGLVGETLKMILTTPAP